MHEQQIISEHGYTEINWLALTDSRNRVGNVLATSAKPGVRSKKLMLS